MRRILTAALASSLLALAIPAAASAHHASRHHRRHHKKAHTVVFAPSAKHATSTTTEEKPPTPPTEPVATVASFEGGVLKITLPDGSTVSGKVTESTEISCGCDPGFSGGDQEWQHDGQQGDDDQGDNSGPTSFHHDDEQGPQGTQNECGVSSLVPGAKVKEAELRITGQGAEWEKVELLPKS